MPWLAAPSFLQCVECLGAVQHWGCAHPCPSSPGTVVEVRLPGGRLLGGFSRSQPSHGKYNTKRARCTLLQVCLSVVGVLGDLCRNVEEDILPYCDEIMQLLIHNLGSNDVHRTIKPQVSLMQDRA